MASIIGLRFGIAPGAYRDINLFELAEPDLPASGWAPGPDRQLSCTLAGSMGSVTYRLIPQCTSPEDPTTRACRDPLVLYYLVYDPNRKRNVFAVGPDLLDGFGARVGQYFMASETFYGVLNSVSVHEINASRTLSMISRGDFAGAARALGKAWLDALQDPLWWLQTTTTVAGGLATVAKAPAAAGSEAVAEARGVARRAGQQAAESGTGPIYIGMGNKNEHLKARIEVSQTKVTYHVTSISAVEAKTERVLSSAESAAKAAHREMIIQSALNARRLGLTEFTVFSEQAGPMAQASSKRAADLLGEANSFRIIPGLPGQMPNCEVRLKVEKVLAGNGPLADPETIYRGAALGWVAEEDVRDRAK